MADGKVIIDTELNTSGAVKGINTLKSGIGSAVGTIAKIGTAGVAAGSALTGALTKSAVDSYGAYEQLVGGIETLFADAQQTVYDNAKKAYITAGLSQNEYMENVISYAAALKKSTKDEYEAAQIADQIIIDMADNVNRMGTDISMVQNAFRGFTRSNYTMLDNLALGYAGNKEGMQELLDDAEKLTGIHYEIGNMADMANAIHAVQVEMGITGTTTEEAMGTLQGSARSAKAAWDNLVIGLGYDNADIDELINNFIDSAEGAFNNIFPRVVKVLSGIGELISKLMPKVLEKVPSIVTQAIPNLVKAGAKMFRGLVEGILIAVPEIADMLKDFFTDAFDRIGASDFSIFDKILSIAEEKLPTLIPKVTQFISNLLNKASEQFPNAVKVVSNIMSKIIKTVNKVLPTVIKQLPTLIGSIFDAIIDTIAPLTEGLSELLGNILDDLPAIISSIAESLKDIVLNLANSIVEHIPEIAQAGVDLLGSLLSRLPDILGALAGGIVDLVTGIVTGIIDLVPKIAEAGVEFFSNLWNNKEEIFAGIGQFCIDLVENIKNTIIKLKDGIIEIGGKLVDMIGKGLQSGWETSKIAFKNFTSTVKDGLYWYFKEDGWKKCIMIGEDMVKKIWEGIKTQAQTNLENGKAAVDTILSQFDWYLNHGGWELFFEKGLEIVSQIWKGIYHEASNNWEKIKNFFDDIMNGMDWYFNQGGLEQCFKYGVDMVQEMWDGFSKKSSEIVENIKGFFTDLFDTLKWYLTEDGWKKCYDLGMNIIKGIWSGFQEGLATYFDNMTSTVDRIVGKIQKAFEISSPSKLMRDEVGKYLAEGIWVGFEENNPMDQINNDLKHGMRGLNTTLAVGNKTMIDYDKIGESVTDGFIKADVKVAVDNREFGRLERGYA